MTPRTRSALAAVAWLAALAAAGGVGAWSLASAAPGGQYDNAQPLDDEKVRRELAGKPKPSGSSASAKPSPSASPAQALRFEGGSATADCLPGGWIYLRSWSPAAGYRVAQAARGPAGTATLELALMDDDDEGRTVVLRCSKGKPVADAAVVPTAQGDDDDDDADDAGDD